MSAIRLWRLTPDRVSEWCEIRLEALQVAADAFGSTYDEWEGRPLSEFAARLANCEMWAAGEKIGAPQAVASWEPGISAAEPDLGWIMSVYVRPSMRGKGLGDAIFACLIQSGERAGMTRMGLHVGQHNHPAQALYRRAGFIDAGHPAFLNARGYPEIEMRRMISPSLGSRFRTLGRAFLRRR